LSYFITGTDTGVGKTLVSCALLHALAAQGRRVAGFKPVAAGCDKDGHNEDAVRLRAASTMELGYEQVNPYCLYEAIAPHIAAKNEDVRIELPRILAAYRELAGQTEEVIVEGAGGFLVPMNDKQTGADLAQVLRLPIILVVGMRLGCLNHAMLTMRAIGDYGLACAGWVANVLDEGMPALQQNIAALCERIEAPLLGVMPFMAYPDAKAMAGHLRLEILGQSLRHLPVRG
jgi:dethiobiotin synthetase